MSRFFFCTVGLLAIVMLVGCSKGITVSGKVKFDDGSPLTKGEIHFVDGNKQFNGTIQSDGSFQLAGAKEGDGIEAGKYQVFITGAIDAKADDKGYPVATHLIADKFATASTSGLTCDISGKKDVELTVTKPNAK